MQQRQYDKSKQREKQEYVLVADVRDRRSAREPHPRRIEEHREHAPALPRRTPRGVLVPVRSPLSLSTVYSV